MMIIKKLLCVLLLLSILICDAPSACAETEEASVGFGFVNAKDVALRREAGGKIIARLPKDACVWVKDSKTDAKGVRWLRLNAALNEGANVDYTGWMKAEFVDTADEVWHDVVDVSCGSWGMIALKKDGTAETAGRPVADPVTDRWVVSRRWTDRFDKKIRQARSYVSSMLLLFEDGTFAFHRDTDSRQTVNGPVRLLPEESAAFVLTEIDDLISLNGTAIGQWICPEEGPGTGALSHITAMYCSDQDSLLMFTDEGNVLAARITGYGSDEEDPVSEMPDWSEWTHLEGFYAKRAPREDGVEGPCWIAAGLEKDGTVRAWPAFASKALAGWSDLKEIRLEHTYALGLKKDGTVVSAGFNGYPAPDVSAWTGIAAVRLYTDFCVGIREDGTLAFAGEHVFMREGHEKK